MWGNQGTHARESKRSGGGSSGRRAVSPGCTVLQAARSSRWRRCCHCPLAFCRAILHCRFLSRVATS